jgi:aquaporin Z
MRQDETRWTIPWRLYVSELLGTTVLLAGGLSVVIFMSGTGSPMERILPSVWVRQTITGFLFGCVGASIALSSIGKESGAHINPAVTLGFCYSGSSMHGPPWVMSARSCSGRSSAPFLFSPGVPLGRSVDFGATVPGAGYTTKAVLMGEAVTTFALIAGLCVFLGFRHLRRFTPAMMPVLYAVMVPLESSVSGTSTNPARTIGPALLSGRWDGWWIYWLGPFIGTLVAVLVFSFLARRIEVAKLYHFESDRRRLFHRMAGSH